MGAYFSRLLVHQPHMLPNTVYRNVTDHVGWPRTEFRRCHRVWHHCLWEKAIAFGSGVVEAVFTTLVAQSLKRSGMRWRKARGPADQTVHALIKSGSFDRTSTAPMVTRPGSGNDIISPSEDMATAA